MVAIAGAGVRRASTALPWYWCSGGGGARCAGERSGQLGRRTQRGEQEIRNNTVGWRPSGGRVSRRAGPDGPAPDEEANAGGRGGVSIGWGVLANFPVCRFVGLSVCWLVDLLGSWRIGRGDSGPGDGVPANAQVGGVSSGPLGAAHGASGPCQSSMFSGTSGKARP